MYKPNNREELQAMQSLMPINAFGAFKTGRKAKKTNANIAVEPSTSKHNVVWMDELRSTPILPVDSTFLVCLYRHF